MIFFFFFEHLSGVTDGSVLTTDVSLASRTGGGSQVERRKEQSMGNPGSKEGPLCGLLAAFTVSWAV